MFHDNIVFNTLQSTIQKLDQYSDVVYYYLPLGIIGLWRWGSWILKKFIALFYIPKQFHYKKNVSVVSPVYNEDPKIFEQALKSWGRNKPLEIIAVIDYTDKACIKVFKNFAKTFLSAKLIVTKVKGKRPALVMGIKRAIGEIVSLVDSDTIWSGFVLRKALSPFKNPKIAGVGTRQNVLSPETLSQKLFDIQLDQRYFEEMPFLAAFGGALTCLSGRTVFYRRKIILPLLYDLENEFFLGERVISGDDKRLTFLIQAAGWKAAYQANAQVFTPGTRSFPEFLKQRLRWTRNSWRADLRALWQGWVFKHPALTFHLLDRLVQPFVVLLSPIFFLIALSQGFWQPAVVIVLWWFASRGIKIYPHLRRRPQDVAVLPIFILFNFLSGFVKIYALFTLNTQGWITRWDISRLPKVRFLQALPAYATTTAVFVILINITATTKQSSLAPEVLAQVYQSSQGLVRIQELDLPMSKQNKPKTVTPVAIYHVKNGDSLFAIASQFNKTEREIVLANMAFSPNENIIRSGLVLAIPLEDLKINYKNNYHTQVKYFPKLQIFFDSKQNTIYVSGRGNLVKLSDIASVVGDKILQQTDKRKWHLKANLIIKNGVTLILNKDEVEWLKLESKRDKFVRLQAWNGAIIVNGVKITSWDSSKNDFDKETKDGRSYVIAKFSSLMSIVDSELAYLGYLSSSRNQEAATFGVSWKIPQEDFNQYLLTGEVKNSKFHHNYFGIYTYGAKGIRLEGNEFYDNWSHGIVFQQKSESNSLVNNSIYSNNDGVVLFDSSKNFILDNSISHNSLGIRVNGKAQENIISNNTISENLSQGIYLYNEASKNVVNGNLFKDNSIALYIKTADNSIFNNTVKNNRTGIYLRDQAANNKLVKNNLEGNKLYAIFAKVSKGNKNFLIEN